MLTCGYAGKVTLPCGRQGFREGADGKDVQSAPYTRHRLHLNNELV